MTFLNRKLTTRLIEVSLSSAQTASAGDFVLFDTIRATGSHGVTVNSSTGEIGLDPTKQYSVQASIHVNRSSATSNWSFSWHDSSGTQISAANGGYDANFVRSGAANSTYVAVYQSLTPLSVIKLKATVLGASSTILTNTKLIIVEVTP